LVFKDNKLEKPEMANKASDPALKLVIVIIVQEDIL
jgi:hypothetical protein